jgi:hypothetical protein
MRLLVPHPLLLALGALILLPVQEPPQDPTPAEEAARQWRDGSRIQAERMTKEIVSAWQLVRCERPSEDLAHGDVAGYALFTEGYMSLEIHLQSQLIPADGEGVFFQSGVHRWRFDESARLETVGLIGVDNFNDDEEFAFESPGERRQFRAWVSGDELVLERTDTQTKLTFQRLGKLPFPGQEQGRDFYGRKAPVKKAKEKPGEKKQQ